MMRRDIYNELNRLKEVGELLNKSEISRRFNCSRNTVTKYLKGGTPNRMPRETKSILESYKSIIMYKVDTYGLTSKAVFTFLQKKGYTGSYSTVNNFIKKHKEEEKKKATIRFETNPGLQAQVDWKEKVKMINKHGEVLEVNIFLMVLGYSRCKFLMLTTNRTQKTLFHCLFESFRFFQGVPKEILFDNMATVVDREKTTFKNVAINKNFKYFAMDAGFDVVTCRPYRPQTKGKVETLSKLAERLKAYNEEFETFEELEEIVMEFNEDINKEISQATNERPYDRLIKEKEYLNPLPIMDLLLSYFHHEKEYKVTKESMINYKGKKYSVPTHYIGKYLTVSETETKIKIYYNNDLVTCHSKTDKILHYKRVHAFQILKSDALRHYSDEMIDEFIEKKLKMMDILLE